MFTSDLKALLDQQALQGQDPECRYIIDRVNWEQYEGLLARSGDSSAYRGAVLPNLDIEFLAEYIRYPNSLTAAK
jgi:hypothetical protein